MILWWRPLLTSKRAPQYIVICTPKPNYNTSMIESHYFVLPFPFQLKPINQFRIGNGRHHHHSPLTRAIINIGKNGAHCKLERHKTAPTIPCNYPSIFPSATAALVVILFRVLNHRRNNEPLCSPALHSIPPAALPSNTLGAVLDPTTRY